GQPVPLGARFRRVVGPAPGLQDLDLPAQLGQPVLVLADRRPVQYRLVGTGLHRGQPGRQVDGIDLLSRVGDEYREVQHADPYLPGDCRVGSSAGCPPGLGRWSRAWLWRQVLLTLVGCASGGAVAVGMLYAMSGPGLVGQAMIR